MHQQRLALSGSLAGNDDNSLLNQPSYDATALSRVQARLSDHRSHPPVPQPRATFQLAFVCALEPAQDQFSVKLPSPATTDDALQILPYDFCIALLAISDLVPGSVVIAIV